ncbi:MAG TPA: hypothetical protein VGC09_17260 [Rhodopila sp.]
MAVSFHQAFEAAISRFSSSVWVTLAPEEQTKAIYEEMRRLDAEHARMKDTSEIRDRCTNPT